jgi:hypothetical protein
MSNAFFPGKVTDKIYLLPGPKTSSANICFV